MGCDWPALVFTGDLCLHYYFCNALRISCGTAPTGPSPGFDRTLRQRQGLARTDEVSRRGFVPAPYFSHSLNSHRPKVGEIDVFIHRHRLTGRADIDLHLEADCTRPSVWQRARGIDGVYRMDDPVHHQRIVIHAGFAAA